MQITTVKRQAQLIKNIWLEKSKTQSLESTALQRSNHSKFFAKAW